MTIPQDGHSGDSTHVAQEPPERLDNNFCFADERVNLQAHLAVADAYSNHEHLLPAVQPAHVHVHVHVHFHAVAIGHVVQPVTGSLNVI